MTWFRWIPGKWHVIGTPPVAEPTRYNPNPVTTLCGRNLREPDQTKDDPVWNRCPGCENALAQQQRRVA